MRSKLFAQMVVVALVATVGFTGCKHPAKKGTGAAAGSSEVGGPGIAPLGGSGGINSSERPFSTGDWKRGQFDIVYFDYDSSRIRPAEVSKVEAVATYLKAHASTKLIIEGHADERGTAEYNRALSERRALACREELVRLGATADNISTVGYGKEKPAVTGHDDSAWAKNRRCEFATAGQ